MQWVAKALPKIFWGLWTVMSIQAFATLFFSERARAALLVVFNAYEIFILLSGLVFLPLLYYVVFVVIKFIKIPYLDSALVWFFRNLLLLPIKIPIICSIISIFAWGYWAGAANNMLYTEMRSLFETCVDERMMLLECEQYVDPLRLVSGLVEHPHGWGISPFVGLLFFTICFFVISAVLKITLLVFNMLKKCFIGY